MAVNSSAGGSGPSEASEFYLACKQGNKLLFDSIITRLDREQISKIDPAVGSTPLHAASFFGHPEIVRALLSRGADRTIRNKFGKLAEEEASKVEVKQLFGRYTK